jgi:cobalamin biosynthesis protein CobT
MKTVLLVLVLGLLGGAAGGYYGRPALDRAILGMGEVEGVVVSERREGDRLLLTLRSGDETIVASFVERADDVAELVSEGDTVTVRVGARGVFADDVPILRLRRAVDGPEDPTSEASEEDASADEEAGDEEAGDEEAGDEEAEEAGDAEAGDEEAGDAPEEEADEAAEEPETDEAAALRVASEARRGRREDRPEASPAADVASPAADVAEGGAPPPAEIVVPASIEEALAEATRRARARRHRRAAARRGRTVPAASPAAESEAEPATVPSEASRPVAEAAAAPPSRGLTRHLFAALRRSPPIPLSLRRR